MTEATRASDADLRQPDRIDCRGFVNWSDVGRATEAPNTMFGGMVSGRKGESRWNLTFQRLDFVSFSALSGRSDRVLSFVAGHLPECSLRDRRSSQLSLLEQLPPSVLRRIVLPVAPSYIQTESRGNC